MTDKLAKLACINTDYASLFGRYREALLKLRRPCLITGIAGDPHRVKYAIEGTEDCDSDEVNVLISGDILINFQVDATYIRQGGGFYHICALDSRDVAILEKIISSIIMRLSKPYAGIATASTDNSERLITILDFSGVPVEEHHFTE